MNARKTTQEAPVQKSAIAARVERHAETGWPVALVLTFKNGESLSLVPEQLTERIRAEAEVHGLKQKLIDAAAIARNPETGRSASVQDKLDAVRTVFDRLTGANGTVASWNAVREGGASAAGGYLFKALCRLYASKTPDQLREWLGKKTDAEKAALRKNPKIAEIIEELKAEEGRDAGEDKSADLLAELDDMGEAGEDDTGIETEGEESDA